jgi:hypothetical protein
MSKEEESEVVEEKTEVVEEKPEVAEEKKPEKEIVPDGMFQLLHLSD